MIRPEWPRADAAARRFCAAWQLLLVAGCTSLLLPPTAQAQLTLELTRIPAATPAGATIYLAGSFNGWAPGDPQYALKRAAAGSYTITLPASVRGPIEFKFTLGSWLVVETDATGNDIANRAFTVPATGSATWTGTVAGWRDPRVARIRATTARQTALVMDTAFAMPQLGRTRRIWLYRPPDYATSTKRFPVIYMHDGQNLFDAATAYAGEWGIDETLDSLYAAGDSGAIVVGIDNGGTKRLDEYSPWRNERYGGGEGAEYVAFIVETLKPYIDAHYRTLPDRLHTGIAGSSMGGLISLYAILKYPHVFGRAGVFSPSLWFSPEIFALAKASQPLRPDPRIYFVTGGLEVVAGGHPATPADDQTRMVEALTSVGFKTRTEVAASTPPDGRHAEWFWRREFPAAYRWLFETR